MPTTINASNTTGGAVVTGDGSGILELQSGGVTGITVNGPNVTVAGTITSTGGLASPVTVAGNSTAGAEIRLPEDTDNGSNYVAIKAPNALAANVTFTLPTADGTNGQFLRTDGSGALSFASVSPGGTTGQVQYNNAGSFGGLSSGTSGQALISQGAGVAPTWGVPITSGFTRLSANTFTPSVTMQPGKGQAHTLDADRVLYIVGSSAGLRAFVYNKTTNAMGSVVSPRTSSSFTTLNSQAYYRAFVISSSSVLLVSCALSSNVFEAVVLSISGTTITVNTPVQLTAGTSMSAAGLAGIAIGSSYVFAIGDLTNDTYFAVTVSGTTPTFSSGFSLSGSSGTSNRPMLFDIGSNTVAFVRTTGSLRIETYSVSGTTFTSVGSVTASGIYNAATPSFFASQFSSGRIGIVAYNSTTTYVTGIVVSFAAGVPSVTTTALSSTIGDTAYRSFSVIGNQMFWYGYNGNIGQCFNILTDNAGTATSGTEISIAGVSSAGTKVRSTNTGMWVSLPSGAIVNFIASGNNPSVTILASYSPSSNYKVIPSATNTNGSQYPNDNTIGLTGSNPQNPYSMGYNISSSGVVITNANGSISNTSSPISVAFDGTNIKSYVAEQFNIDAIRESDDTFGILTCSTLNNSASVPWLFERWKFVG